MANYVATWINKPIKQPLKNKNYITDGDCYQVNLAKRYEVNAEGDPWIAYQQLRKQNAAPFSAFLNTPQAAVLSSSPERLLRVKNNLVETKPIKGTRPRDLHNAERDRLLAQQLQDSLKDRAENVMIVDLLRNDLGKVCAPGSISVPSPFALESFATVHHLVSTITGTLAEDQDAVSLLRACFPGDLLPEHLNYDRWKSSKNSNRNAVVSIVAVLLLLALTAIWIAILQFGHWYSVIIACVSGLVAVLWRIPNWKPNIRK